MITFEEHPRTGELRKEIVVGQVRSLIASLNLTNTISPRKSALIHPAEAMNVNSANALLKTLEEPPGETVLILDEGNSARQVVDLEDAPIRAVIVGIVDEIEVT